MSNGKSIDVSRGFQVTITGLSVGLISISYSLAYASLIFNGDLAYALPIGLGVNLFGALLTGIVAALFSPLKGLFAGPQDTPAIVLSAGAAAIAATVASPVPTVIMMVMLSTLTLGLVFWLLGFLGLGSLTRYLPFPVLAGFLVGVGFAMISGAMSRLSGADVMFDSASVARWLPAVATAIVLTLVARYLSDRPILLPIMILVAGLLVHVWRLVTGVSVAEAQDRGLLLGPFEQETLWNIDTVWAFDQVNWGALTEQLPSVLPVFILFPIALLLYLGGTDQQTDLDVNTDRELKFNGLLNMLAVPTGSSGVGSQMGNSVLSWQLVGQSRGSALVHALASGAILLLGPTTLNYVPTATLNGLLMFVGGAFVLEWIWDSRHRLPRTEYVLMLITASTIVFFGFLIGVGVGIAIAVLLFVVRYSQTKTLRHQLTSKERRSNVQWPAGHHDVLTERGDESMIVELEGFLFFGSAAGLFEPVVSRLGDDTPLRTLVIDFRRVVGIDSAALDAFDRLAQSARDNNFEIAISSMSDDDRDRLITALSDGWQDVLHFESDLDMALEWAERRILTPLETGSDAVDWEQWLVEMVGADNATKINRYWTAHTATGGDEIVTAGRASPGIIALTEGSVSIYIASSNGVQHRRRSIKAGSMVGEISTYLGGPATASIRADGDIAYRRLSPESFAQLSNHDPKLALAIHRALGALLAERVLHSDRVVNALLR